MTKDKVALSQTQLGIYFESVKIGNGTYNIHLIFTLDKSLDMDILANAIDKVVQAHPYMEVRITDDLMQFIPDLSQNPYHQNVLRISEKEWQELLPRLVAEPLELIGGRLFRFELIETEKAKYMFGTVHHIAFDGLSMNTLIDDITAAYNGVELTSENYNSLDFAFEETQLRADAEYQKAKEWYEKHFFRS